MADFWISDYSLPLASGSIQGLLSAVTPTDNSLDIASALAGIDLSSLPYGGGDSSLPITMGAISSLLPDYNQAVRDVNEGLRIAAQYARPEQQGTSLFLIPQGEITPIIPQKRRKRLVLPKQEPKAQLQTQPEQKPQQKIPTLSDQLKCIQSLTDMIFKMFLTPSKETKTTTPPAEPAAASPTEPPVEALAPTPAAAEKPTDKKDNEIDKKIADIRELIKQLKEAIKKYRELPSDVSQATKTELYNKITKLIGVDVKVQEEEKESPTLKKEIEELLKLLKKGSEVNKISEILEILDSGTYDKSPELSEALLLKKEVLDIVTREVPQNDLVQLWRETPLDRLQEAVKSAVDQVNKAKKDTNLKTSAQTAINAARDALEKAIPAYDKSSEKTEILDKLNKLEITLYE
ncbi:MAG: hypothetical protein PHC64_10655 [Candidatus Gastranaerophilales bacterium]|nr:hypothetical protein [Candidatus Gastranaerophilales bacterium]